MRHLKDWRNGRKHNVFDLMREIGAGWLVPYYGSRANLNRPLQIFYHLPENEAGTVVPETQFCMTCSRMPQRMIQRRVFGERDGLAPQTIGKTVDPSLLRYNSSRHILARLLVSISHIIYLQTEQLVLLASTVIEDGQLSSTSL